MTRCPFTVVVDTREQTPFDFRNVCDLRRKELVVPTTRAKLDTGDYSIAGLETRIAVERKTKADLYRSLGADRDRFRREIVRLATFEAPAIVVECGEDKPILPRTVADRPLDDDCLLRLLSPPPRTRMNPRSVLNSLIAWSVRHRIPVWLCGSRRTTELVTFRLLQHFWNGLQVRLEA